MSMERTAMDKNLNQNEITARAYRIWEASGRLPGSELKNWLQAEKELVANPSGERTTAKQSPAKPATSEQELGRKQPALTAPSQRGSKPQHKSA